MEETALKERLCNVLWLGGSPGAGKTSAARYLAERYGYIPYHFDRHEPDHIERHDPSRQRALHEFLEMDMDERWVLRSPEAMAYNTIRSWTGRFELVLDDLLALPREQTVIAEGPGLFPALVAPLLTSRRQALWLVPDPLVLLRARLLRGATVAPQTSDPPRAFRNIITRDRLLAAHVIEECRRLHLTAHVIRAEEAVGETIAFVEEFFVPLRECLE